MTFILTRVYSWGLTPTPEARSWSIIGSPSRGEKMVCLGRRGVMQKEKIAWKWIEKWGNKSGWIDNRRSLRDDNSVGTHRYNTCWLDVKYASPFAKPDLVSLLQFGELPHHKRLVVWIGISGEEWSPPIHLQCKCMSSFWRSYEEVGFTNAKLLQTFLREVFLYMVLLWYNPKGLAECRTLWVSGSEPAAEWYGNTVV